MFYSNNIADPSKGAHKKVHGGMAMHTALAVSFFLFQVFIDPRVQFWSFFIQSFSYDVFKLTFFIYFSAFAAQLMLCFFFNADF